MLQNNINKKWEIEILHWAESEHPSILIYTLWNVYQCIYMVQQQKKN